jgi:abnormal spindle-like microcephaly-associated protein
MYPQATPCPIAPSAAQHYTRLAMEGDTCTFDCTTDLQAAFKLAAPRRRTNVRRKNGVFTIHEDETKPDSGENGVQKFGRGDGTSAAPLHITDRKTTVEKNTRADGRANIKAMEKRERCALRKDPRRRTIFVPSEDTTILTIHPGMKLAGNDQTLLTLQSLQTSRESLSRSKARKSLAAPPRRGPLQPTLKPLQESGDSSLIIPGPPTGKENVPPGGVRLLKNEAVIIKGGRGSVVAQRKISPKTVNKHTVSGSATTLAKTMTRPRSPEAPKLQVGKSTTDEAPKLLPTCSNNIPPKLAKPIITPPKIIPRQYELLEENISQPQMFEERWLSNQETAITELINSLFATASSSMASWKADLKYLRGQMMEVYQSPPMVLLYKRLQASLLYGALNCPKETAQETARLMNDLAVKRKFIHLWTKTYNIAALRVAAEVVVGRKISLRSASSPNRRSSGVHEVEAFLETCLLQNEDTAPPKEQQPSPSLWSWRRTMQRSLMLINLLDKAKEMNIIPVNLFRTTSTHKSSSAVLKELEALIAPSRGDMSRALGHLDYQIIHTQYPLSEYEYPIKNLAVDLRDGVRLTHLAELLLYPPSHLSQQHNDTTAIMPIGGILASVANEKGCGVLSQYLKFPCVGRATKLHNVQIALNALQGVKGLSHVVNNIQPEDIVDGHREKTMIMLWGLVGNWGLDCLVDKADLVEETRRLRRDYKADNSDEEALDKTPQQNNQRSLLRAWAKAVAAKHGLKVCNLTTSFADGNVFECLVDEYRRYLGPQVLADKDASLETKLKKLGCSASFASIFGRTAQAEQFFDADFTTAALAYFSSRLLGASQQRRRLAYLAHDCMKVVVTRNKVIGAATTIQRAWRNYIEKKRAWVEDIETTDIWLV